MADHPRSPPLVRGRRRGFEPRRPAVRDRHGRRSRPPLRRHRGGEMRTGQCPASMLLKRFSMRTRAIGAAILLFAVSCRSSQPAATASCDNDALTAYPALLVLAPHPDDETLGFTGLIDAYRRAGKPVSVVVVTDGDAYCEACRFWKNGDRKST